MYITLFLFFLLTSVIDNCESVYKNIYSKLYNVTFKYNDNITGENSLHECKLNEACNIVHNRFWMSTLTERLCRCPNGKECPWEWTNASDEFSLSINNRSVLKFCSSIEEMNVCNVNDIAAIVYGEGDTQNSYLIPINVTVNCICPRSHFWKLQKYAYEENMVIQKFKCQKKRTCDTLDFCGYIRSDIYSSYYKCSCPQGHLCVYENKTQENVQEFLYTGPAYKAYCYRY